MSDIKIAARRAFRINTDETYELFDLQEGDAELKQCQAIVGGLIEPIDLPKLGLTMWVNEEGLMLDIPVNRIASAILSYAYRPVQTVEIKGDVYFTNIEVDDEGNVKGLEEQTAQYLWALMRSDKDTTLGNTSAE